ncbi:MAG TPA: hypothetical protein VKD47_05400 [Miltoncostaeaceae bacterium]|nr:hypothetical protein [Miltoncostaeaceae bacterium]
MRASLSAALAALGDLVRGRGNGIRAVVVLGVVVVLLQVTLVPRIGGDGFGGTPDLVAALVVSVALLRGTLVGAVTGFSAGLLVELLAPTDTLGVLALLYLAAGAWCGRFAESPEPPGLAVTLALVALVAALVPVGVAVLDVLRGQEIPIGYLLGRVALPQALFSAIFAPLVVVPARRLLGPPRVVEPLMVPR